MTFFSVYPAFDGRYMNTTSAAEGILRTQLIPEQSPVKFNVADDVLQPTTKPSGRREIIGYPDMNAGVMVACNDVEYGAESVSLNYKMINSVIDITVNGPTAALINSQSTSNQYVDVYSIRIVSKDESPIVGVFDYDAVNNKLDRVVNGQRSITIQLGRKRTTGTSTSTTIIYPRLYNYASSGTSTSTPNDVDQLRLRAFVLPGVEPKNLTFYVETSLGYYELDGSKFVTGSNGMTFTPGEIHRMKLPLFDEKGRHEFDYTKWMEQIDPTVYVTELSIPGSWNSFQLVSGGTNDGEVSTTVGGYQVTDYLDQYAKGVRAFSARVKGFNNNNVQSDTGTNVYIQTDETESGAPDGYSKSLKEVLANLGEKVRGSKEFVVFCLRGVGTPGYASFDAVKAVLDANSDVYKGEITPETTAGDVSGKIVIKSNAEAIGGSYAGTVPAAGSNYPSMFSDWADGTQAAVRSVPLDWGAWTQGTTGTTDTPGNTGMRWCFTECDNIVTTTTASGNTATVAMRQAAVDAYIAKSLVEYNRGEHDTWMYLLIGGQNYTAEGDTGYGAYVATQLNTYAYQMLAVGDRATCPMGLVMMNYASSTNPTYNSANLIRTIINNNNAFVMAKRQTVAQNDGIYTGKGNLTGN